MLNSRAKRTRQYTLGFVCPLVYTGMVEFLAREVRRRYSTSLVFSTDFEDHFGLCFREIVGINWKGAPSLLSFSWCNEFCAPWLHSSAHVCGSFSRPVFPVDWNNRLILRFFSCLSAAQVLPHSLDHCDFLSPERFLERKIPWSRDLNWSSKKTGELYVWRSPVIALVAGQLGVNDHHLPRLHKSKRHNRTRNLLICSYGRFHLPSQLPLVCNFAFYPSLFCRNVQYKKLKARIDPPKHSIQWLRFVTITQLVYKKAIMGINGKLAEGAQANSNPAKADKLNPLKP